MKSAKQENDVTDMLGNLSALIHENTRMFFAMNNIAETLHGHGHLSAGLRTILLDLSKDGPRTVPDMARLRNASRQYVQTMVNQLQEKGLVAPQTNPSHQRSKLIKITKRGETMLSQMLEREINLAKSISDDLDKEEIANALDVMRVLRHKLELWPDMPTLYT